MSVYPVIAQETIADELRRAIATAPNRSARSALYSFAATLAGAIEQTTDSKHVAMPLRHLVSEET